MRATHRTPFCLLVFWTRTGWALPAGIRFQELVEQTARLIRQQGGELVEAGGGDDRFYALVELGSAGAPHDLADVIQTGMAAWLRIHGPWPEFNWDADNAVISLTRKEAEMLMEKGPRSPDKPLEETAGLEPALRST
jgi:hypothetical protein